LVGGTTLMGLLLRRYIQQLFFNRSKAEQHNNWRLATVAGKAAQGFSVEMCDARMPHRSHPVGHPKSLAI
jgi:hypothetical protein